MRFLTEFFGIFGIFCFKFGFGALNSSLRACVAGVAIHYAQRAFWGVNSQNGYKFVFKKRTACVMDCRANPCGFARNDEFVLNSTPQNLSISSKAAL